MFRIGAVENVFVFFDRREVMRALGNSARIAADANRSEALLREEILRI